MRLDQLDPVPYGFPACGGTDRGICPYYRHGSVEVCYACASVEIHPPPDDACPSCAHPTQWGQGCDNWLCRSGERHYERGFAIGLYRGALKHVVVRYKTMRGWAPILARLLVGWLDERLVDAGDLEWDLIAANPSAPNERGRDYYPGQRIWRLAHDEDAFYPFDLHDPPVIVKTRTTPSMTGRRVPDRERIAVEEIYPALEVPDESRVAGRRILVVDDVYTSGNTINQIARRLMEAGASSIDVLVFVRRLRTWAEDQEWPTRLIQP